MTKTEDAGTARQAKAADLLRMQKEAIGEKATKCLASHNVTIDFQNVVEHFARLLEEKPAAPAEELATADLDEYDTARLLRVAEAVCIDILREQFSDDHADVIVGFRDQIRHHIPRTPVEPETFQFFEQLFEPPDEGIPDDQRRLIALFHGIMASLDEMVYVHDLNGVVLFVNKRGMALTGFVRDDFYEGMSIYDLLAPESVPVVEDRLSQVHSPSWSPLSVNVFTKSGTRVPIRITTRPLIEAGVVTGVIGVGRPLIQLDKTETKFETVISSELWQTAPMAVFVTNGEGVIQQANPAAATLAGANDISALVGKPLHKIMTSDEAGQQELQNILLDPAENQSDFKATTPVGRHVAASVTVHTIYNTDGRADRRYVFMQDIGPREEIRQRLVRAEKLSALGNIMAGISHELNNPLTGILGYTQLILASDIPATIRDRVDYIAQEAQRCQRIVENLLSFAQKRDVQLDPQNINELLDKTLQLRAYQFRADNITIETSFDDSLSEVRIDRNAMQSVFLNILNNAHRALQHAEGRKEKRLTVRTGRFDDGVEVVFGDNGIGISNKNMAKVFDPFFTTKEIGEGTGLGLSVSYGVVHDHGGDILVDSTEGEGTTVTIRLPADQG